MSSWDTGAVSDELYESLAGFVIGALIGALLAAWLLPL